MADDVKAGDYELVHQWDEVHSKPGEALNYTRHRPGDVVHLSAGDAQRLVGAGSAVPKGELARRLEDAQKAQAAAVIATLPDDVREQFIEEQAAKSPRRSATAAAK